MRAPRAVLRRQVPAALWGVAALLFGLLAAAPLLANPGFLLTRGGGDSPFLLQRLHELAAALAGGQFPARWMPNADYGFGYPFFNYYAALPYYLAALFHFYGFSYVAALKLTQLAALLLAAAGAFGWARSLGLSQARALLAAAAYSFAPFHLVNLYVRGDSLSELWAMSFYPLVLWAAQRCLQRPRLRPALALAASTALLVLSHNISALNFMPFVGLCLALGGLAAWPRRGQPGSARRRAWRPVLIGLGALAWGLALSAFFWLPALREISAVQLADVTQGYFYYGNHFRAADLVQPSLFFNAETGAGQPTPFSMGLVQALATVSGGLVLLAGALRSRRWTTTHTFLLAGLGLATFMITPASAWLWAHLPLLRYTQFPWRFLSIQALFAAALIGHLAPAPRGQWLRRAAAAGVAVGVGLLLAVTTLGQIQPDFIPLADADVTPQRLELLEYFSANIGSTIGFEYLPRAVAPRPYASAALLDRPARLKTLQGQASGSQLWQRGADQAWTVIAAGAATVALPTHAWPGWTASVDGHSAPVRAADGLGWITLDVPAGTHTIVLSLASTPTRALAGAASLLALALPAAYMAYWALRAYRRRTTPQPTIRSRFTRIIAVCVVVGLLALGGGWLGLRALPAAESKLPLSIDFAALTYLHHDVVRFEGGTELTSVSYSADHLARGQNLMIQTTWSAAAAGTATLSLVPASNLLDQAPAQLGTATQHFASAGAATQTNALPVPLDIPPGVYFVTVQWTDQAGPRAALTGAGRARGLVHLAPVWIDDPGRSAPAGAPLAEFGPAIALLSAQTSTPEAGVLQVNPVWQARQDVAANDEIALRLRDAAGAEWAASDTQMAYGYYPTSMWRPGEIVPDFYRLRLPDGTPPGQYTLDLSVYNAAKPATPATLGAITLTTTVTAATPKGARSPRYALTPEIGLAAVAIVPQFQPGDAPELRADWLTTQAPPADTRARWTLVAADGSRVSQVLDLAPGSPTTTWPADAYIQGRVRLGTAPNLAPGHYALALALVDTAEQPLSPEVTVAQLEVLGRPHSYSVPPVQTTFSATYGGVLKLWGYDSQQTPDALRLTLVWSALAAPGRDYKFFVHLFNPDDGSVPAQVDAIPRHATYPTAIWLNGEVITDTIQLPLAGVPPGNYQIAVGWYDPNHPEQRLPAVDAQHQPLADDRAVLPLNVRVP